MVKIIQLQMGPHRDYIHVMDIAEAHLLLEFLKENKYQKYLTSVTMKVLALKKLLKLLKR